MIIKKELSSQLNRKEDSTPMKLETKNISPRLNKKAFNGVNRAGGINS